MPLDNPDWTRAVAITDTTTGDLVTNSPIPVNGVSNTIDSSNAASLIIQAIPPGGGAGDLYVLAVQWFEGGTLADLEYVSFGSSASYQGGLAQVLWQTPVRGSSFLLAVYGPTSGSVAVNAYLSTRSLAEPAVRSWSNYTSRLVANLATVNVGAGANTVFYYVPPTRRCMISPTASDGKVLTFVQAIGIDPALGVRNEHVAVLEPIPNGVTGYSDPRVIEANGSGLLVYGHNYDTVASTWGFNAWDVG